jgi:hypothetical protein
LFGFYFIFSNFIYLIELDIITFDKVCIVRISFYYFASYFTL